MSTPHSIAEFFRSPWFEYIALPCAATAITVFVKAQTKPLIAGSVTKQEWAVGIDLLFAVILSFATYAASLSKELLDGHLTGHALSAVADKQIGLLYASIISTFVLWFVSALVRSLGWENEKELNNFGIFFPLLVAAIAIMTLGNFIGS